MSSSLSAVSLELYRRRWTAYFSLPFGVVVCIAGIGFVFIARNLFSGPLGVAVALFTLFACLCVGITVTRSALKALKQQGPALIFDMHGITSEEEFIPWDLVERISSTEGEGNALEIWFKGGSNGAVSGALGTTMRRAFLGADKSIDLGGLVYHPRKLSDVIARLHQQAQIVGAAAELKPEPPRGW